MDVSAVPRDVGAGPPHGATRSDRVGMAELVGSGLRNTAVQTIKLARTLPTLARFAVRLLRPSKEEPVRAAKSGRASAKKTGWLAPKTPINVSLSERRAFSSFSLPQSQLKQIARGHGVTLNDVVLAICSGALRHYLADHNCKPKQPLLAAVPVSLREEGNTDMNTQASMLRISLASHIADPIARLLAIRKASASIKAQTDSVKSVLPTDFPSLGVPWLISGLAALYVRSGLADNMAPLANLIISNVRGSKVALYLAGARMLTYYPVSIPIHGMALNITVQSYNGSLDFGLIACAKAMPDLPVLAKHMKAAHLELLKLTPEVVVALKAKRS
jgi:diacylglycerol O-acyltransferase